MPGFCGVFLSVSSDRSVGECGEYVGWSTDLTELLNTSVMERDASTHLNIILSLIFSRYNVAARFLDLDCIEWNNGRG